MTGPTREHAPYDELAAGYALHALDPADELQFRSHLPTCPRCQEALGDFTDVAAALAENWSTVEPSPQLGERIMAAVVGEPASGTGQADRPGGPAQDRRRAADGRDGLPAGVADLTERRNRRRLTAILASAAAAAVLIAGGAVWGELSAAGSGTPRPTAGCVRAGTCRQVVLTDARSHAPDGKVIVIGGTVWLVPSGLPADDTASQIYVLWQITGAHTPLAVGSFDVRGHGDKPVKIGSLAVPYHGTWAFAVSLEHGRTIPATPSHPVALGQVPS